MRSFSVIGAALCAWLALSAPAHAQRWVAVETTGFTVYTGGQERRAYELAYNLEQYDALLRRATGAPTERSPTRLEVYLFSEDQFEEAFPYLGSSIAGVYMARTERIAAYSIFSTARAASSQETLYHEYAHHFMYQYFNNAYPAWYIEGFAELMSTVVLGTERIVIGRSSAGRARFLETEIWMPMEQLITTSTSQIRNGRDMQLFYAQSWLFAHYLLLTPGAEAQFRAYVRALRLGQPARDAFQTGFDVTPEEMQSTLRRYLRDDPNAIALTNPTHADAPETRLITLPASAERLMPVSARLASGNVSDAEKTEVLARVRQLAGAAPYDDFSLFTLARAEIRLGSPATARALLEPYLTANENSRDALYLMGLAYLREADDVGSDARTALLTDARRYLGRGYRLDGNHVPTLARYAETYAGEYMSGATYENYVNILLLARQLAPQVDEISLNAASVLVHANRQREAVPILRALAYDPHAGGNAQVAQRLLAEAEGRPPAAESEPAN